jgi:PAS domain S-box-containing protein
VDQGGHQHEQADAGAAFRVTSDECASALSAQSSPLLEADRSRLEFQALILRRVNDAVIAIDSAGLVTYLNPSAERLYGLTATTAVGRPLSDIYGYEWITPDEEARAEAALAQDGFWRGENRHVLRNGRVLHVESSVSVLHDNSGAPAGLLAVIRDITDAKRAEDALRNRDERFGRALASETVGVLFFTLDGRITDANACFERMSGYHREELRHLPDWRRLTDPQFLAATERAAAELLTRGETAPYEKQMIRKDGSRWWGLFAPRQIDGRTAECIEFIIDITQAKRAEAALRESDERHRMALDAADLGTWKHDISSGRVHLDARAQIHYGIDRNTADIGDIFARIHPDDRSGLQQAVAGALDPLKKLPVRAEYRVLQPGGGERWLSVNGHVHFEGPAGAERPVVGVGTTRDVTVQRRAEEALREADRRKDEFLAILAHELRNPLAPVRTAVGILRSPGVPEPLLARSRDIIERQVAHMTRLIDDLLDVSRLSRGKMTLQCGPLLLDQVLDAAIETARPIIEEHLHHLEQRRATTPVCVDGDAARLSQVFANLLNNAAKYTPAGGKIAVDVVENERTVDIQVTDTGEGIVADRLDRIFELFAQGSGASSPAIGGLGIGLALARRLVELHGGTLRASSPGAGQGATFTVTLPTIVNGNCDRVSGDEQAPRHLGRRVLVVDDSVDAADTTATLLEAAGCVVRARYSGEHAVAEITEFQPEIVLLDLGMPGVNGIETCRRMRALPGGCSVFIVAVTGWGQEDDRRRTRDAGFDAHLVKPVEPNALLDVIEHARRPGSGG